MDATKKVENPNPQLKANPLSKLFFWWMKDLFWRGARSDLNVGDLYNALPTDQSELLGDKLEKNWNIVLVRAKDNNVKPSLLRALLMTFGWSYMVYGFFVLLVSTVFRVAQPIFLGMLIRYFNAEKTMSKAEAYWYAGGVIGTSVISIALNHHINLGELQIGMRIRVACCSLIYRKILRLSKTTLGQTAAGQVVNLLSNDVNRFDQLPLFLHYIWILPIQTAIITYFIWDLVGVSAFIGVGSIFLQTIPVQGYMSKLTSKLRLKIATRTDHRVKLMNEIISGIQVIKMYAWEKHFEKMVCLARKYEIDIVTKASYLRGMFLSFMVFSERTSLFLTLVSYVLLGNSITADKVFAMAQFYNILQLTMAIFYPQAVQLGAETKISIQRLQNFLLLGESESKPLPQNGLDSYDEKVGVVITNGLAKWTPNLITDTLRNVYVRVRPGKLCAVVGPVASGKSSLLHAILGELPLSGGSLSVGGSLSYSSQEPWLFVGSVRQNILFGQPYNSHRYKEVVKVCALTRDFELFPHGDKTLVGERGVSLSGGQRARINLARAVYRQADVYLLDDPLSAVDTHVGKHLFDQCIQGYLRNKTRILVTHQLQYLKDADLIVILNNGQIEEQGTYHELSESKLDFANLLTAGKEEEDNVEVLSPVKLPRKASRQMSIISTLSSAQDEDEDDLPDPTENDELLSKGNLNSSLYWKYFRAGASPCLLFILVAVLIIGQVASSGADYWVTYWTNQEQLRQQYDDLVLKNEVNNLTATKPNNITDILPMLAPTTIRNITGRGEDGDNATEASNATLPDSLVEPVLFSRDTSLYIYSVCILGSVIITSIRSILFFKVCMRASKGLHNTMFQSILAATMRFFDTNPSGRVLNRFSKDIGSVDEQLPKAMLEAIQVFLVMTGILTMVAIVNYWMIIPMVVIAVLFYKIRGLYLYTAQDIKRLEGITRSPVFSHLSASLNGLTTIRASNAEGMVRNEFDNHQDLHTSAWYLTIATSTTFGFWLDCISAAFVACVTLSFLILDDGTYGGNVGLAISQSLILTGMLQYGMGMLQYGIRMTAEVVNQMTAVERVLEYTKIEKEPGPSQLDIKPPPSWPADGAIQFDRMTMRYSPTDPPVLKDLSFTIQPAQKVGIVGRTGAGKSSLISALFRLTKLEGAIKVDGVDTQKVALHTLRSRISIIPQEPVLFSASLRYNLDPFNEYGDNGMWSALQEVQLNEAVDSLEFEVNEGGSNLSAGQRQLVCLARAIVRNNKILVLDEATANVDPQTDALIQGTIRTKFEGCTVLTIAHRLNTVMDSDMILVMEAGSLVEFDHPHILLQNEDGYFYKMVQETGNHMAEQLHKIAKEAYNSNSIKGTASVEEVSEET